MINTLDLAKEGPVIPVIVINKVEDAVQWQRLCWQAVFVCLK